MGAICTSRIEEIQLKCTESSLQINTTNIIEDTDSFDVIEFILYVNQINNPHCTFTPNVINSEGDMDHYDVAITISKLTIVMMAYSLLYRICFSF